MSNPWDGVITEEDLEVYRRVGFGRSNGLGARPALLVIDVQYRTVGRESKPIMEAIADCPTSCGEAGWRAVGEIARLIEAFRRHGLPVLYPHVAPKRGYDAGRFGAKVPAIMEVPPEGYDFVREVAPLEGDILVPKNHASAFFGTSLASHLVNLQADSIVVTGCTTSGCIRASVVDASSFNYKVVVPQECVFDRSAVSHAVNLFDMASKYADVAPLEQVLQGLERRSRGLSSCAA